MRAAQGGAAKNEAVPRGFSITGLALVGAFVGPLVDAIHNQALLSHLVFCWSKFWESQKNSQNRSHGHMAHGSAFFGAGQVF